MKRYSFKPIAAGKRIVIPIVLAVFCMLVISDGAHAIEGFRGATWGGLQYDMPRDGDNYLLLQGYVKQGIDWWRYKNTTLNTYGVLRYKFDSEETPWNNALAPGIGVSLDIYNPSGFIATVGFEYQWEKQFYPDTRTVEKGYIYLDWVGWWDLMKH